MQLGHGLNACDINKTGLYVGFKRTRKHALMPLMSESNIPTAAVLIIGNEILSGRTQDSNLNAIAQRLGKIGIQLKEARVIPDVEQEIVEAVNVLRKRYTHVISTGGIGPTHDDITADSIAKAFGVQAREHPEAKARLASHYAATSLTEARLRMARIPEGATLIDNPISAAPGFNIENVYVLAGVPEIMCAMMDNVVARLEHGPEIYTKTVSGYVAESAIAEELGAIAAQYHQLDIGSYPWVRQTRFGTALVTRGIDRDAVEKAGSLIFQLVLRFDNTASLE